MKLIKSLKLTFDLELHGVHHTLTKLEAEKLLRLLHKEVNIQTVDTPQQTFHQHCRCNLPRPDTVGTCLNCGKKTSNYCQCIYIITAKDSYICQTCHKPIPLAYR